MQSELSAWNTPIVPMLDPDPLEALNCSGNPKTVSAVALVYDRFELDAETDTLLLEDSEGLLADEADPDAHPAIITTIIAAASKLTILLFIRTPFVYNWLNILNSVVDNPASNIALDRAS